jgi:hypothetical protein
MKQWEALFKKAVNQLEAGRLSKTSWVFGGGTVLMTMFNHRHSKDIDIFLNDPQLLAYVSPRVNDGAGEPSDYIEETRFVRLFFDEGEIDFIAAPPLTNLRPIYKEVAGIHVYVENPLEIIAKKAFHRAENFTPRDVFDMAVVYEHRKHEIHKIAPVLKPKLENLAQRLDDLENTGHIEQSLEKLRILDDGRRFRGREMDLCRECVREIEKRKDHAHAPQFTR